MNAEQEIPVAVAGVIVTYNPDADFEKRAAVIADQVALLVIVDNSEGPDARARVAAAAKAAGAETVVNRENLGLAAALNQAFANLTARGFEHAIAFDQDSTPEPGFTAALLRTQAKLRQPTAVVGANWFDEGRPGFDSRHLRANSRCPLLFDRLAATSDLTNVTCVITSGSLFWLPAWEQLGGFDDGLFLDLVDTDFCLRARLAGFDIAVSAAARLAHRRGAKEPVRRAGRTWWPAFMPPFRLRYLWRNRLLVATRHGWRRPHWLLFELAYATKVIAEITLLEDQKLARLAACARGTWDGLLGSEGRIHSG